MPPTLKYLQRLVIPRVSSKWFELGIELLDESHTAKLDTIKNTYPCNFEKCCFEMFRFWLEVYPKDATWYKVTEALKSPGIDLMQQAAVIEEQLKG